MQHGGIHPGHGPVEFVAILPASEYAKVKALVFGSEGKAEDCLGDGRASICLVVVLAGVLVHGHAGGVVDMVHHIGAEIPDRISHIKVSGLSHVTAASGIVVVIRALQDLIVKEGKVSVKAVVEIPYLLFPAKFKVNAPVQDFADIHKLVGSPGNVRSGCNREKVRGNLVVIVHAEG